MRSGCLSTPTCANSQEGPPSCPPPWPLLCAGLTGPLDLHHGVQATWVHFSCPTRYPDMQQLQTTHTTLVTSPGSVAGRGGPSGPCPADVSVASRQVG